MASVISRTLKYTSRWSPISIVDEPIPAPLKPYQVVVKADHLALNPIDIKLKHMMLIRFGVHPVMDFGGEIEQVGEKVTGFKVGDKVSGGALFGNGGFTGSRVLLDTTKDILMKAPSNLSREEAGSFTLTFGTALKMLEAAPPPAGSNVLVVGGGSVVGNFLIQLLKKQHKVGRVVSINSAARDDLSRIGIDKTIDYRSTNVVDALTQDVERTGRFDLIFDTVGGTQVLDEWNQILKPAAEGGSYTTSAGFFAPGGDYSVFGYNMLRTAPGSAYRLFTNWWYGLKYQFITLSNGPWVDQTKEIIEKNNIKVPIDSVYPFEDFQKAWDRQKSAAAKGKVVLKI